MSVFEYEGYEFVLDEKIDFLMLRGCYLYGGNCYNCYERVFDGCILDEVDIEEIIKNGKEIRA